jgi:hypothetical protein
MSEHDTTPQKTCFVVGPIGDPDSETRVHADWFLEEIVEPVFRSRTEFKVVRADKMAQPGMIDAQVIEQLFDADIVVADLSFANPNAFYEIGIRHMAEKPIIHMQLADESVPFDISLYRAIKFSRRTPSDLREAREQLHCALEAVLSPEYRPDNPVIRARGQINIEKSAAPEQKVLIERFRAIETRLEAMERIQPIDTYSRLADTTSTIFHIVFNPESASFQRLTGEIERKLQKAYGHDKVPKVSYSLSHGQMVSVRVWTKLDPDLSEDINKSLQSLDGVISVVIKHSDRIN